MPYRSQAQERFFEAVRHGWKPDNVKTPPMSVVNEFHDASVNDHHLKPTVKKKLMAKALRDGK